MDKHCLDANFVSEPQFLRALNSRWARKLKRLHVFRLSFPGMMIQGIAIFNSFWLGKNSVSNCRNCWVLSVSITGEALRQGLNFRAINWNSTVSLAIVPHHSPSSCSKRRISYLCHSISKENKNLSDQNDLKYEQYNPLKTKDKLRQLPYLKTTLSLSFFRIVSTWSKRISARPILLHVKNPFLPVIRIASDCNEETCQYFRVWTI